MTYHERALERFWGKVDKRGADDCWEWQGASHPYGYGHFYYDGKQWTSHRFSCFLHYDDFDENKVVRHLCHNPSCVNPAHLRMGTQLDNARDSIEAGRDCRGEDVSHAKLTEEKVRRMRRAYAEDPKLSLSDLAAKHGVDIKTIHNALRGDTWSHVEQEVEYTPNGQARGEKHGCAKLTAEEVRRIRALREEGLTYDEITERTPASRSTVAKIIQGKLWAHLD